MACGETSVALLRGINVGGARKLPMKTLAAIIESVGGANVRTYIQSGNAVFEGDVDAGALGEAIEAEMGFRPHVFVLTLTAFKKVANDCPFAAAGEADGKAAHVVFLDGAPAPDAAARFDEVKTTAEDYAFKSGALHLHSPAGLSKSRIAEKMDRIVKGPTTARNWNTIKALIALGEEG